MKRREDELQLTVLMPCLNEEASVGSCVDEAFRFMKDHNIKGEVLVVDNGSTDNSRIEARKYGARTVLQKRRGYGAALRTGIRASRGRVIIMGDCDTTYDFYDNYEMYRLLSEGKADVVIGNRFAGGFEKGAVPFSHKIGARILSFAGRLRFHTDVADFHCGLRGLTKEAAGKMRFYTTGMEFATEMIAEAARKNLRIRQVAVRLRRCCYARSSKLRTIRDGFRHLIFILRDHADDYSSIPQREE